MAEGEGRTGEATSEVRAVVLQHFRWVDGHADVWRVFRDAAALKAVVVGLVDPFRSAGITAVAGVESRGFLLGGAAAVELGVGFVAVRKPGPLLPGAKARGRTDRDYRGIRGELLLHKESLRAGDRVLLVDDWAKTGSSARTVATMVALCGARVVGVSVVVDRLDDGVRRRLPPVHSLLSFGELPTSAS